MLKLVTVRLVARNHTTTISPNPFTNEPIKEPTLFIVIGINQLYSRSGTESRLDEISSDLQYFSDNSVELSKGFGFNTRIVCRLWSGAVPTINLVADRTRIGLFLSVPEGSFGSDLSSELGLSNYPEEWGATRIGKGQKQTRDWSFPRLYSIV